MNRDYEATIHYASDHVHLVICEIETPQGNGIGSAKCAPEDAFDIEVGMRIAFVRAMLALTASMVADLGRDNISPTCVIPVESTVVAL